MKTFTISALASGALVSFASAQEQYQISPDSVSSSNREYWCQQQLTQCPLICLQPPSETPTTSANTCDADSLSYNCVCADGLRPNVTQYTQTLPFFICQEWGNQCVTACGTDNACSAACRQDHPCGAQDPIKPNSSTISSTMSASASASQTGSSDAGATTDAQGGTVYSGFGRASSTGGSGEAQESAAAEGAGVGRAAALEAGHAFGLVALAGAFFGGFALVL